MQINTVSSSGTTVRFYPIMSVIVAGETKDGRKQSFR